MTKEEKLAVIAELLNRSFNMADYPISNPRGRLHALRAPSGSRLEHKWVLQYDDLWARRTAALAGTGLENAAAIIDVRFEIELRVMQEHLLAVKAGVEAE